MIIKLSLLAAALSACAISSANNAGKTLVKEERDAHVIVKLKDNSNATASQASFLKDLSNMVTSNYKVTNRIKNVGNIIMLDIPSQYVDDIRTLSSVSDVGYDSLLSVTYGDGVNYELTNNASEHLDSDNASAETMQKPSGTNEGEGTLIAILDTGYYLDHECFQDLDQSVNVKVTQASLQTAYDNADFHAKPDATHSTYHNRKIPFYYDYGGETSERGQAGPCDYDVYTTMSSHGQHCASIAAGNGPYKGISPKAQLALMKVFTCYTPTNEDKKTGYSASVGAYDSAILLALEDAAILGVDVVSMSLGSDLNDFEDNHAITFQTIKALKEAGTFVVVAAGNGGKEMYKNTGYEYWSTEMTETGIFGSYANCDSATIVAAAQANWQFYEEALLVGTNNVSFYDQVTNYNSTDGPVEYTQERHLTDLIKNGNNTFNWVKVPNWGESKDYKKITVKNKIAVVDRGETTFTSKVQAAVAEEAIAVIIIDNDATKTDFDFRMDFNGYSPTVPVVSVLYRDRNIFKGSGSLDLIINKYADNPTAKQITTFSSDGATYDLRIGPNIAAPGQQIKGAIIELDEQDAPKNNGYDYYDGTSMATPNYAGCVALMLSDHLNDATYRSSLTARLMSTAEPMKDGLGKNYVSPRRQGAGLVNLTNAKNSQVYLEGKVGEEGTTKASIELKNNDDIKQGNVNLSFFAYNESTEAKEFTATTYLYKTGTGKITNENYTDIYGATVSSIEDELITKLTEKVILAPGKNTVTLNSYSLTSKQKAAIDKVFENGCYLEGYVVMTNTNEQVSIPFMGFYGDYADQAPVEPFTFERDPNKTYQSDILNTLGRVSLGNTKTDFRSAWVTGYFSDMSKVSLEAVIYNENNVFDLMDSNLSKVVPAGINPYTEEVSGDNLNFGNNGFTNTMIIQQFVTRSVTNNTITLKNKATGDTILTDHMFDSLFGSSEPGEEFYGLYKSHAVADYFSSGILAHRAYTIIPLYNFDKDTYEITSLYPDGEYEMEFSYTLAAGGTYTMKYNITIDSESPTVKSVESVIKSGKEYLRIRYNETNISYAVVNGTRYEVKKDSDGCYCDILKTEVKGAKIWLKNYNMAYSSGFAITHKNDAYQMLVANNSFNSSEFDFTTATKDNAAAANKVDRTFTLSFKKGASAARDLTGTFEITLKLTNGLDPTTLEVYDFATKDADSGTKLNAADVKINGIYVTFTSTVGKFTLKSDKVNNPVETINVPNDEEKSSGGCGGSLIASSTVISIVSLLGICLLKKRKVSE